MSNAANSDKIIIQGIQFYGYHGVSGEEQATGHRYAVDLELSMDLHRSGQSDSIEDTINYAAVARLVIEIGSTERYHLLEALAERIAAEILARYSPQQVRIRLKKLLPPTKSIVEYAAVELVRPFGPHIEP
ncbi:MAG TPA: dihydroneopterin aldolase [Armatimonadota bacterium]|nr:dihydroneopterin aldolase [Armatimonadota bacterium]